ncbi:MAG: MFS transporter [Chloroflexi bacterium]|nr:MFS transporter [Chloroflexota bacterium]
MSYRSLLGERRFLLLLLGQTVSTTGDWLASVALLVFAYERTGSGLAVGAMGLFQALPAAVLGLMAGALADRWDRRRTMAGCDVARAVLTLALATLPPLPFAFGAAAALSVFGLLFSPAYEATIPNLVPVEKLVAANALESMVKQALVLVGPALGALVVGLWGPGAALFFDGVSFLASAATVAAAAPRRQLALPGAQAAVPNFGRAIAEGLGFVAAHRMLRRFVVIDACRGLALGSIVALSPIFMARALGLPPATGGYLITAAGAGMLGGSLVVGLVGRRCPTRWLLVGGMWGNGLSYVLFALMPNFTAAAGVRVLTGASLAPSGIARRTLLQMLVPDALRGRVFGVLTATSNLTSMVSMAAGGALADILGIREVYALAGLVIVAGGVVALGVSARSAPRGLK